MRTLAPALVALVAACNALNGVGDLHECGDDCGFGPDGAPPPADGSTASDASPPPGDAPGQCTEGQSTCQGNVLQSCVGGALRSTPCADPTPICANGACIAGPASCRGAQPVCGPNKNADCCASVLVPPGSFDRKNDGNLPATITAPFKLDVYEVTVGRFRAFVNAGMGTKLSPPFPGAGANPKLAGSGWAQEFDNSLPDTTDTLTMQLAEDTATWAATGNDTLPINNVSWTLAFAFCIWDGGRLPTDAEWNLAAAAGSEQRVFPWGASDPKSVDPTFAVYDCAFHLPAYTCESYTYCSVGGTTPCDATACSTAGGTCQTGCNPKGCELADIAPVGSRSPRGDSKYGHADLAGNVAELVLDNDVNGDPKPCPDDCFSPMTVGPGGRQSHPRVRGGAWSSTDTGDLATTTSDRLYRLNERNSDTGFRCARDP